MWRLGHLPPCMREGTRAVACCRIRDRGARRRGAAERRRATLT
ncbi:hypothetical protein N9L68_09160 [bacterium]|nr:hypothetical protein [bacterium]